MSEKEADLICSVTLVGEQGVGKTELLSQFSDTKFCNSEGQNSISAAFIRKKLYYSEEKKSIEFDIWDTAGQRKFLGVAKIYLKSAKVCILVYDITNQESFDGLKNFWYPEIKNIVPKETSKKNILLII